MPTRGAEPITTAPSRNCTLPVGEPAPGAGAATVAVKVTGRPEITKVRDALTERVVLAWMTVCVTLAAVVLPVKLVSPP